MYVVDYQSHLPDPAGGGLATQDKQFDDAVCFQLCELVPVRLLCRKCSVESAICASKQCQSDILRYACLCNYDVQVANSCLEFIYRPSMSLSNGGRKTFYHGDSYYCCKVYLLVHFCTKQYLEQLKMVFLMSRQNITFWPKVGEMGAGKTGSHNGPAKGNPKTVVQPGYISSPDTKGTYEWGVVYELGVQTSLGACRPQGKFAF